MFFQISEFERGEFLMFFEICEFERGEFLVRGAFLKIGFMSNEKGARKHHTFVPLCILLGQGYIYLELLDSGYHGL